MKFIYKKLLLVLLLGVYSLFNSQSNGPGSPCFPGDPCDPPASPIDMYVYLLAIFGIIGIVYFGKKNKIQKV